MKGIIFKIGCAVVVFLLANIDINALAEAKSWRLNASISTRGINISGLLGTGGGGGGNIAGALCEIVYWFTEDGIGSAIASLAVIFLGIGAFFGKVTWGTAVLFATGIVAIFGSQQIVSAITYGYGGWGC